MRRHELKSWPAFFAGLVDGTKTAEVRLNDRDFREGDVLVLREYDLSSDRFTGREQVRRISRVDEVTSVIGPEALRHDPEHRVSRVEFVLLSFERDDAGRLDA